MRLAIAGAGRISELAHIPAFQGASGVKIVAIQSRTTAKAEDLVRRLWTGAHAGEPPHVYTGFDDMLVRERPDAVGIFTPNYLHCEFTLKALAAGAHVLVEKPIAPTVAEARRMIEAAKAAGRVLMTAMQRRHSPLERAVKECLEAGIVGRPHFIRLRLSHGGPEFWAPGQNWFFESSQAGGGAMLDLGVHIADLALWFMGEVESVIGYTATLDKRIEVEDNGIAMLRFRSGAAGVLEASWTTRPPLSALEIHCSEGRVMMGYPRLDISIQRADGSIPAGYSRDELLGRPNSRDPFAANRALASNFIAAIQNNVLPFPDGTDGMRAVEIIEACYRSARIGRPITLPLD
jgi:predicted dehydrogenase